MAVRSLGHVGQKIISMHPSHISPLMFATVRAVSLFRAGARRLQSIQYLRYPLPQGLRLRYALRVPFSCRPQSSAPVTVVLPWLWPSAPQHTSPVGIYACDHVSLACSPLVSHFLGALPRPRLPSLPRSYLQLCCFQIITSSRTVQVCSSSLWYRRRVAYAQLLRVRAHCHQYTQRRDNNYSVYEYFY